jgi:hypothetical protein
MWFGGTPILGKKPSYVPQFISEKSLWDHLQSKTTVQCELRPCFPMPGLARQFVCWLQTLLGESLILGEVKFVYHPHHLHIHITIFIASIPNFSTCWPLKKTYPPTQHPQVRLIIRRIGTYFSNPHRSYSAIFFRSTKKSPFILHPRSFGNCGKTHKP